MSTLELIFRIGHIAGGSLALVSGSISLLSRKGGKSHVSIGKVFYYAMAMVFITALFLSLYKDIVFLLMISFFSFYQVFYGYRSVRLKQDKTIYWLDILAAGISGLFNLWLLVYGVYLLINGNWFGTAAIIFGLIGAQLVYSNIRKIYKEPESEFHWLYAHIAGMSGGFIAALTAFLVVNVQYEQFAIITWLLPTVVGVPFLLKTIRKYRRKLEPDEEEVLG